VVAHPQIQIHNWGRGAPTIAADSDEYDVELERAVVYPPSPSNLSAAAGDMNSPDQIDDDAAEAKEERRASPAYAKDTVRQLTSKSAASCEDSPGPNDDETSIERKTMKKECDLFYQVGIWLIDGASAINCNVEHFYDGFFVQNSGEVKKSEASGNRRGVVWLSGSTTKISDV